MHIVLYFKSSPIECQENIIVPTLMADYMENHAVVQENFKTV